MKAEPKISKRKRDGLIWQINIAIIFWENRHIEHFSGLCTYTVVKTSPDSPLRKLIKNYNPAKKWRNTNYWFEPFATQPRIKLLKQFLDIAINLKPNCP